MISALYFSPMDLEIGHRLVARQHLARHRQVFLGQFRHALFDGRQVFRRKRARIGKVVIETVLDHRADGHLRLGKQLFHRIGQQVRGGMADQIHAVRILVGDDGQLGIGGDQVRGIHQHPIHLARQRGTRQTGTDALRDLGHGHGVGITALRTIR